MTQECPSCGSEYTRLAMHWNRSECEYPSFSNSQWQLLKGLLMGDADIHGLSDTNSHFRLRMTKKRFLEHIDDRLGVLSKGVYLARTAKEQYETAVENQKNGVNGFETVNEEGYTALYGLRSCSHPMINKLGEWYSSGEKRYPKRLDLTPEITRMWYACDGWLAKETNAKPRAMFKVTNESNRSDFLIQLFESKGFSVGFSRQSIQVPHTETVRLLNWMGKPPVDFEYKWRL